jgi:hypothetical protein
LYGWARGTMNVQQVNTDIGALRGTRRISAGGSAVRAPLAGRTFPSAAGFHTAELFFTDDSGVYLFATRDAGALVQAHHLDLDFYDRFFKPGAYLRTHAEHMQRWHGERQEG